jgi:hypothetical protein
MARKIRITALVFGFATLAGTRSILAAESCNQTEIAPGSEGSVSVLLPDIANNLRPRLTARDARASKPVDPWGACPTTEPYGPCTPAGHGNIATVATSKIFDPGDGMQLIGFRLKNAAGAVTRDVRLCVQYGSE